MIQTATPLRGHAAILTAAPYHATPEGPAFLTRGLAPALGDAVTLLGHRPDGLGNVAAWSERFPDRTWKLHRDCLTLLPSQPAPALPARAHISREIAAHVLNVYAGTGYAPGGFTRSLIALIASADQANRALLALGFPGYVAAVTLAQEHPRGREVLTAIQRDDRAAELALYPIGEQP